MVEIAAVQAEKVSFPNTATVAEKVFKDIEIDQKETFLENTITMMDGLNHALKEEMQKDASIIVFGQDVAGKKGGVFGITRGLTDLFTQKRCFNTPLAESTIIGVAAGMAMAGKKIVCEIQFA